MKEKVSIITGASGEIGQNLIARFEKIKGKKKHTQLGVFP